jgi:hypothetical protein
MPEFTTEPAPKGLMVIPQEGSETPPQAKPDGATTILRRAWVLKGNASPVVESIEVGTSQ